MKSSNYLSIHVLRALATVSATMNHAVELHHFAVITSETRRTNTVIGLAVGASNILTFAVILADSFVVLTEL